VGKTLNGCLLEYTKSSYKHQNGVNHGQDNEEMSEIIIVQQTYSKKATGHSEAIYDPFIDFVFLRSVLGAAE
jgi:hypothetical protein